MAVWSEVTLSTLQYTRFDGEFYSPQYIKDDRLWAYFSDKYSIKKLGKLLSSPVRTGHTPRDRRITKDDELVHFIKTNTLREGRVDYSNCFFLPKRVLKATDFIPNDSVVVTIIGATPEIVGRTAIIRDIDPARVTNQNVAIIETSNLLDPYYLTAYFQTKYGRDQLWRHSRRTEQVNLNCREVERVIIPYIDIEKQKKIGNLIRDSFSRLDLSQSLYTQAQQLLERELGLDKLFFDKPLSYEARLSEVVGNNRADADYYQTRYKQLRSHVSSNRSGIQRLIDFATVLRPNIDPSKSPSSEFKYVELADINPTLGIINSANTLLGKELPSRARREVAKGDVIASSVVGSVDKAALVDEANDGCLASTGFFHFRPKNNIKSEFLLLLVRSRCVTMQLQQESTGGILSAVPDQRLRNVIIPNIDPSIQNKIADLVYQSHKNINQSKQLLEQAKRRVEELIEQAVQK